MMKHQNCLLKSRKLFGNHTVCPPSLANGETHRWRFQSTSSKNYTTDEASSTKFAKEWAEAKPFEEIPTLSTFKFLRNFLPGGKYAKLDSFQMIMAMKADLGSISKMNGFLGRPAAVLSHNPDDFEKVLRNEGIWPVRPGSEGLNYHRSVHRADFFQGVEGLIATQGEKWGTFRSAVNPVLLQPKNVRLYLNKMAQVNKEFLERIIEIRDPDTFEVPATFEEELNRWTLESISVVALDKQLGLINSNRDDPNVKKLFAYLTDFFTLSVDVEFKPPIWKIIKTKSFKKLMETLDGITDITSRFVDEALHRIEEEKRMGTPEKAESEKSVLEKLVKIDKKIATVMAMDMLMAGVDTTSSAFTALLLCLAKNPEKQAILRQEVIKALPSKDSEFDEATFRNMPYLRACLKESLRLYPLVLGTARHPVNDVVLSGYRVPKGTQVSIITTSLLDNDAHFPRAKEFLPERWLRVPKENRDSETTTNHKGCPQALKTSNPFIYIPFGFGARSCVGRRITEMEMELGAARLVRNFHIEFNHPTENAFKSLFIRIPNIPLTFKFSDVKD